MYAGEDTWSRFPEFLPVEIVGGHEHLLFIKKAQVDSLAIGGGRAGGPTVQAMDSFQGRLQHDLAPEFLTAFSI